MLAQYIIYNTTTGEITKRLIIETENGLDSVTNSVGTGEDYVQSDADPATHYVSSGVVTARNTFTASNSWDYTTITTSTSAVFGSSLPTGTVVNVIPHQNAILNGAGVTSPVTVNDGSLTFSSTIPGTYTVVFNKYPSYVEYSQDIEVTS